MQNKNLINIAVIGAGKMGVRHIEAICSTPGMQVCVVCDQNIELANKQARQWNIPEYTEQYESVLSRNDIDAVYVCLPAALHPEVSIKAMQYGKHVFCEKPLALNTESGKRMVQEAEKADVVLAVGFQHRFQRFFQTFKAQIDSKKITRPICYTIFSAVSVRPNLAMHDINGNGGPFVDTMCHYVDIWRMLFDSDPVRVFAHLDTYAQGKRDMESIRNLAPDTGIVVVEYASGDTGCLQICWGLPRGIEPAGHQYALCPDCRIEITPFSKIHLIRPNGDDARETQQWTNLDMSTQDLQQAQAAAFAQSLRSKKSQTAACGYDGLIALEVSMAALTSARTRQVVEV